MHEKIEKELSKAKKKGKKSNDHENVLCNIKMFYGGWKRVINWFNDYGKFISGVNFKATKAKICPSDLVMRVKILTLKLK